MTSSLLIVTPQSSGWGVAGFVKACPGPICWPALSSFSGVLFLYLLHCPLCLRWVPLPGSSLTAVLGVVRRQRWTLLLAPSCASSRGNRITPVGKSSKATQNPEGISPSHWLPARAFIPLYNPRTHSSHKIITLSFWSQRLNLLLIWIHAGCHHLLCCFYVHFCVKQISSL